MTALFGALQHDWVQCGYDFEAGDSLEIPLEVPDEAFMHELSDSYVTELRVHATVCGVHGLMANTVLAWPDGQDGEPMVWTVEQMETEAPYGVLDSSLRTEASSLLTDASKRLGPPVTGVAVRGRLDTGWAPEDIPPDRTDAPDEDGDEDSITEEESEGV